MDLEAYRELQLLTEISTDQSVTQRSLAKRQGLALGLINFLIRRLVKKGYVKVVNLERKRLRYLITHQGLTEKARLTYEYLEYSLYFYRQVRTFLAAALSVILESGAKNAVLCGIGEVAEVLHLTLQQEGINVTAVVDEVPEGTVFMNRPVQPFTALSGLPYDWVIVTSLKDVEPVLQRLSAAGVPASKIITVSRQGRLSSSARAAGLDHPADPVEVSLP